MKMSMLGKRKNYQMMKYAIANAKRRGQVVRGTRYRSFARRRGPFRVGGFYGASVRSPAERKVIDTANAVYQVNTTGSVTLVNGVATGTDYTDRIGRRVNVTAIQMRGWLTYEGTSAAIGSLARVMLVEDMQPNGVIATPSDILTELRPESFMNMNNRERFKVHYDAQVALGPYDLSLGFGSPSVRSLKCYKKVNIPVVFEGTAATIGSISSGAIYLFVIGSLPSGTGDVNLRATCRMRFVDA